MINEYPQFTVIEFIEFSGPAEFRKFKAMPKVTNADIQACDFDDLVEKLQETPQK